MKKFTLRLILLTLICMLAAMTTTFAANKTLEEQREEVRQMSEATLDKLYQKYPSAINVIDTCYGYATLSNANTNLILVSSSHGRGVAYNNDTGEEVFMRMKEIGIGIGAGAREYDLIFIFANKEAWDKFISGKTKFGGEASATVTDGTSGGAIEGATLASSGIWVYQMTTKGISLEATLNGTKYYTDKKLNKKDKNKNEDDK